MLADRDAILQACANFWTSWQLHWRNVGLASSHLLDMLIAQYFIRCQSTSSSAAFCRISTAKSSYVCFFKATTCGWWNIIHQIMHQFLEHLWYFIYNNLANNLGHEHHEVCQEKTSRFRPRHRTRFLPAPHHVAGQAWTHLCRAAACHPIHGPFADVVEVAGEQRIPLDPSGNQRIEGM